jgi:predicted TIM-barrel fold metal-dependent hydrolase
VLVDTASFWIYVYPGVMDNIVKIVGAKKIVFGTDVPIQSTMQIRFKLEAINSLKIPNDEKENILHRNILNVIEK